MAAKDYSYFSWIFREPLRSILLLIFLQKFTWPQSYAACQSNNPVDNILPLIKSQLHLLPPRPICINCFRNPFPLCSSSSSYAHCVIFCKELKHLEFDKLPWKLHFALFRMKCYRAKFEVRSKRGLVNPVCSVSLTIWQPDWFLTICGTFCVLYYVSIWQTDWFQPI